MPIRSHLNGQRFDAETIRLMGLAYELALISLGLVDRGDMANDVVACTIIEQAKAGERDPERLCDAVLNQWRASIHQSVASLSERSDLNSLEARATRSNRAGRAPEDMLGVVFRRLAETPSNVRRFRA